MERQRKPFSESDYKNAERAFSFLKRDFEQHQGFCRYPYYPVLCPENYGIDVAVFSSKEAYENEDDPIFFIELEIKTESCCQWQPGRYPFPDVHFLYRKVHLLFQEQVPFWVMYNGAGTDCCIVNIEAVTSYPIAQNSSKTQDLIYMLPPKLCTFGTKSLVPYIENYFAGQYNVDISYLWSDPSEVFAEVNAAYAKRHQVDQMKKAHGRLLEAQQRNKCPVGIKQYL